jgi:hypothetical protein
MAKIFPLLQRRGISVTVGAWPLQLIVQVGPGVHVSLSGMGNDRATLMFVSSEDHRLYWDTRYGRVPSRVDIDEQAIVAELYRIRSRRRQLEKDTVFITAMDGTRPTTTIKIVDVVDETSLSLSNAIGDSVQ